VNNQEFKVGDVVKFSPNYHTYGRHGRYNLNKDPIFVVESNGPELLALRCIYGKDTEILGYGHGNLYFGPPSYFVRCSIKDKFRGRELCGQSKI